MSSGAFISVELWNYRDTDTAASLRPELQSPEPTVASPPVFLGYTEEQVLSRVQTALAEVRADWEEQARVQQSQRDAKIAAALATFATQRSAYFRHVEQEIVTLAIAIARKLLEREVSIDPTLLGALVRVALERLGGDTVARIRVCPAEAPRWQQESGAYMAREGFEVVADASLAPGDCLLETPLGTANFGFEAQLKQVEQSFRDLLSQRPGSLEL